MRRETQGPIRSEQALARDRNAQDHRREGGNSPIGQFSPQNTALGKIIREKRRSHGGPGVRVLHCGAGPRRRLDFTSLSKQICVDWTTAAAAIRLNFKRPCAARSAATPRDHSNLSNADRYTYTLY